MNAPSKSHYGTRNLYLLTTLDALFHNTVRFNNVTLIYFLSISMPKEYSLLDLYKESIGLGIFTFIYLNNAQLSFMYNVCA